MKLIALDQASKISGWSFFEDGSLKKYGKFTADDTKVETRLVKLRQFINDLVNTYKPDVVVCEDIQQQENVQTFKVLAEVLGTVLEYLEEKGIPHETVLASSWKSTLGIKGRTRAEQKRNSQQSVVNEYGIKPTQDEADAINIGRHYLAKNTCAW